MKIWDAASGFQIGDFVDSGYESCVTNFKWRPKLADGAHSGQLTTVTGTGWIKKYDSENGDLLGEVKPEKETDSLDAIEYTPGGQYFVVAGTYNEPRVYDDETLKEVTILSGYNTDHTSHANRVFCLKMNPFDPNMIVSGGWDNNIFMYDMRQKGPVGVVYGPHVTGESIDFVDERTVVSGSFKTENQL